MRRRLTGRPGRDRPRERTDRSRSADSSRSVVHTRGRRPQLRAVAGARRGPRPTVVACPRPSHPAPPGPTLGRRGEDIAAASSATPGCVVLDRNWRCRERRDRHRRPRRRRRWSSARSRPGVGIGFGHPAEAVTPAKQRRLRLLASAWLGRAPTALARAALRRRRGAADARPGRPSSTTCAGCSDDARPHLVGRPARRRAATWSRSRPTSPPGCPGVVAHRAARHRRLYEARDRVRAAIVNAGAAWPPRRITVGAARPASLPKTGSAVRPRDRRRPCSRAAGDLPRRVGRARVLLGELGLDGRVRPVRGVLPARARGRPGRPRPGGRARGQRRRGGAGARRRRARGGRRRCRGWSPSLRGDGQAARRPAAGRRPRRRRAPGPGRRARSGGGPPGVEVAAAGGHHLLSPGRPAPARRCWPSGSPACCRRSTTQAALEVTARPLGRRQLPPGAPLVTPAAVAGAAPHARRVAALVGGGSGHRRGRARSRWPTAACCSWTRPRVRAGACSTRCASRWSRGEVVLARAGGDGRASPRGSSSCSPPTRARAPRRPATPHCTCSPPARRRYPARLSGPLLDRVDLRVEVLRRPRRAAGRRPATSESSADVAARVAAAARRRAERWGPTGWRINAEVPGRLLRQRWAARRGRRCRSSSGALTAAAVSARGFDRVLRVAWTLADLAGRAGPGRRRGRRGPRHARCGRVAA